MYLFKLLLTYKQYKLVHKQNVASTIELRKATGMLIKNKTHVFFTQY